MGYEKSLVFIEKHHCTLTMKSFTNFSNTLISGKHIHKHNFKMWSCMYVCIQSVCLCLCVWDDGDAGEMEMKEFVREHIVLFSPPSRWSHSNNDTSCSFTLSHFVFVPKLISFTWLCCYSPQIITEQINNFSKQIHKHGRQTSLHFTSLKWQ